MGAGGEKKRERETEAGEERERKHLFCALITNAVEKLGRFWREAFIPHEKAGSVFQKLSPGPRRQARGKEMGKERAGQGLGLGSALSHSMKRDRAAELLALRATVTWGSSFSRGLLHPPKSQPSSLGTCLQGHLAPFSTFLGGGGNPAPFLAPKVGN